MKKSRLVAIGVLTFALIACLFAFTGCKDKEELHITSITAEVAENTHYIVGSAFDVSTIVIEANLSDGTTKTISSTLSTEKLKIDKSAIKLDKDGKFTEATAEGQSFKLKVTYLKYTTEVEITVEAD